MDLCLPPAITAINFDCGTIIVMKDVVDLRDALLVTVTLMT
jgi:hypothetical protein